MKSIGRVQGLSSKGIVLASCMGITGELVRKTLRAAPAY